MRRLIIILATIFGIGILFALLGPFYIVEEGEQSIVIRFGQIVDSDTEAGLKFKVPFIDTVVKYPKRILSWDGDPRRVPTQENQFIWIDTTARWRIVDPELFYASITTIEAAFSRLDDVIESSVRTVIAQNPLHEAVRNTNVINEIELVDTDVATDPGADDIDAEDTGAEDIGSEPDTADDTTGESRLGGLADLITSAQEQEPVSKGRQKLSEEMFASADTVLPDFGVELIDIIIRQIRYSDDLTQSVYDRMVTERTRIAQAYRSFGEGRKQEILGELEREKNKILSEAFATAEEIRGQADADAARIYTSAYSQSPDFFEFWRAIESYRQTLPKFRKTLTTDLDYFNYLYSENGR